MKYMTRMLCLATLCLFISLSIIPTLAQSDTVILQLATTNFAEDALQSVVETYEAENPGIQVQLVTFGGGGMPVQDSDDPETYQDNLADYFSSADVLLVDTDLTPEATRAGYLLNLSPLIDSDPSFSDSDFYDTLLRSFEWDGGQWALPISTNFVVLSYLPSVFDAANLSYPDESWSLADLESAVRTLSQYDADGVLTLPALLVPGGGGGGANLEYLFLSALGHPVYSESALPNVPDYSDSALESLLDTWLQMTNDGLFNASADFNFNDVPMLITDPQFGGGGGGGFFGGNQENQAEARAFALLPGGRTGLDTVGYAVSSGTNYPEQAYDLVRFLLSDPNAIAASGGGVSALPSVDISEAENQGGFGGPGGPGGFNAIPAALEPMLDTVIERGIPLAEGRFADGIVAALDLMESDGLDARTALDEAQNTVMTRIAAADNRAATTRITVQPPVIEVALAPGEVSLNFAVLAGGGGGFAQQSQWETIAAQFIEADAQVGHITIETENPNAAAEVAASYDCFYSGTNLVPDIDTTLVRNLDPLMSVDPSFNSSDFVAGVFDQITLNNQIWAMPLYLSPLVLRYDHELFSAAGLNTPQVGWTISDFENAIRSLSPVMVDDQTPVTFNASGQSALLTLIAAYGGMPFDTRTDPLTVNFTDPATVAAIQQVLDLVSQGYLSYGQGGGPGGGGNPADLALYSNVLNPFGFGGFGGGGPGGGNNPNVQNTDGFITFPQGLQINAIPFDLGTAYISASSVNTESCYRFISFLASSSNLFASMPVRYSVIDSPDLVVAQGQDRVDFYHAMASMMTAPNTMFVSTNINAGNFGMTSWLLDVFDRYIAGEVTDLAVELGTAEMTTRDYLACVAAIPTDSPDGAQSFFQQIQACVAAANPA